MTRCYDTTMERNDVTSFFFYMWNVWGMRECEIVFSKSNSNWKHFWDKWCAICNKYGISSATEHFYAELCDSNRDLLVARALSIYNGKTKIK